MSDNFSRQSWLEHRRIKQRAAAQQNAWDSIRQQQGTQAVDNGANRQKDNQESARNQPEISQKSAMRRQVHQSGANSNLGHRPTTLRVITQPLLLALLIIFTLVGGSPIVSGHWSPWWLGAGLILSTVVSISTLDVLQHPEADRKRRLGIGLGGGLLLIGLLGMVSQHVVAGKALLHGTALDRAVDVRSTLDVSYKVLLDNQNLLYLPAEQAASLVTTYQDASAQDLRIAKLWNPATVVTAPLPSFDALYQLMNLAAVTQSAALNAYIANLVTPENAIAEQARLLTDQAAQLLTGDIPNTFNTIDTSILQGTKSG